jgi:hypothetical protein
LGGPILFFGGSWLIDRRVPNEDVRAPRSNALDDSRLLAERSSIWLGLSGSKLEMQSVFA